MISTEVKVEYAHRFEYSTQDSKGEWSEPKIRYHNRTESRERALKRHEECTDVVHEFGHEFERIYGYAWKNCRLVKITTRVTVEEEEL